MSTSVDSLEYDLIDQLIRENDDTFMALPDIELGPHLLISKVRKHYMEYVIKLLTINYETNQKLLNKNIYLPSAIWRCAKSIEINAAQACMVVQLYRKNIISVVNELKNDTKKGVLNKKLFECLNEAPLNDKKTQTHDGVREKNCQCELRKRKRRNVHSVSPKSFHNNREIIVINDNSNSYHSYETATIDTHSLPKFPETVANTTNLTKTSSPHPNHRPAVESDQDELMVQLEKLFQSDHNEYDIFDGALCDKLDIDDHTKKSTNTSVDIITNNVMQGNVIENHAAQIKSLDERLASLTGMLVNNDSVTQKTDNQKAKRQSSSKWLCEEYYLKQKLYELLDEIADNNRKNLEKIKDKFVYYFGYDSDDDGIISPLEETPEFIVSCKERIAPWVVKILTPYYIKGHIKGKVVFKSLAKHLIRLIYQCSRYPEEYEVSSFVTDFLQNHKNIRSEADFKEFRIENI